MKILPPETSLNSLPLNNSRGGSLASNKFNRLEGNEMAEVRANIIQLTLNLMGKYPDAQKKAVAAFRSATGLDWETVTPEDWVHTKVFNQVMKVYSDASIAKDNALVIVGRQVYPTIKKAGQIPPEVNSLAKMIKFEGQGFEFYHRGPDVVPRKFTKIEKGDVIIEALSPGYNCRLIEGVFIGICDMFGVHNARNVQTKCVTRGDPTCEYHLTW
jgi:hypothetical protein